MNPPRHSQYAYPASTNQSDMTQLAQALSALHERRLERERQRQLDEERLRQQEEERQLRMRLLHEGESQQVAKAVRDLAAQATPVGGERIEMPPVTTELPGMTDAELGISEPSMELPLSEGFEGTAPVFKPFGESVTETIGGREITSPLEYLPDVQARERRERLAKDFIELNPEELDWLNDLPDAVQALLRLGSAREGDKLFVPKSEFTGAVLARAMAPTAATKTEWGRPFTGPDGRSYQANEATGEVRRTPGVGGKPVGSEKTWSIPAEGIVLSGGADARDSQRAQALAESKPYFDTAGAQDKGRKLNRIYRDAVELRSLLDKPEVQDSLGYFAGGITGLRLRFGGNLSADVARAYQLTTDLSDAVLRERSGAQINEQEFQRMLKFAADPRKSVLHNVSAMDRMIESTSLDYEDLAHTSPRTYAERGRGRAESPADEGKGGPPASDNDPLGIF